MAERPRSRTRADLKRGAIVFVDNDPSKGREQQGKRLVLVVSAYAFNITTRLPVIVLITTGGDFARRLGFAVHLQGTKTTGIVRCDQSRVLDLEDRDGRFVEMVPNEIIEDVLAKLVTIFV